MTHPDLDKLEAALRIVTNAMAEKYPLGTDFGRYESQIRTIIEGAQKWEEHLAAQRQSNNNWLEVQLEEARKDYEKWPEWKKECSRTGEFLRNKEQRQGGDDYYDKNRDGDLWQHPMMPALMDVLSRDGYTPMSKDTQICLVKAALRVCADLAHPPAVTGDRGALEAEWFRNGTLVYSLKHGGWKNGVEIKVNATTINVDGDNAEAVAETLRAALLSAQGGVPVEVVEKAAAALKECANEYSSFTMVTAQEALRELEPWVKGETK